MTQARNNAILAETITVRGRDGVDMEAYFARPLSDVDSGAVVVLHHLPGYDQATKEIVRTFAAHGYVAVCPNLYHRMAPWAEADDVAVMARQAGGVPDEQVVDDCAAAADMVRTLPYTNDKVAVVGFCSGGRQAFLAASVPEGPPTDAVVNCYGVLVGSWPADHPLASSPPVIDHAPALTAPMLGLFGQDDVRPSRADVEAAAAALSEHGKTFEFHTFPDAGHAFFSVDRPGYRYQAATAGWRLIWDWLDQHLR